LQSPQLTVGKPTRILSLKPFELCLGLQPGVAAHQRGGLGPQKLDNLKC